MKLWLLKRTDWVNYDETAGMVVAALSAGEARDIAAGHQVAADDHDKWALPQGAVDCSLLGDAAPWIDPGVVLTDFNAG